jgi:AAA domain
MADTNGLAVNYTVLPYSDEPVIRFSFSRGTVKHTDVLLANGEQAFEGFCNRVAAKMGMSIEDVESRIVDNVSRARNQWLREKEAPRSTGFTAGFIDSATLDARSGTPRWLVKKVLVRDQPAIMGGAKKVLKTSLMIDFALSLACGKPFLGQFDVPTPVPVAILSGESGEYTIRETARRVAKAKGVSLASCPVLWGFTLPKLASADDLAALARELKAAQVGAVFLDPIYLCLAAGTPDFQVNNLFAVGPLLMNVARVCLDVGATPILLHHASKGAAMSRTLTGEPMELEDLAFSGFAEFARQWVLVSRREKYEAGSGKHKLWLNIGGSAGHSGLWGVNVTEGELRDDFSGRRWNVEVQGVELALKLAAADKEIKKNQKTEAKMGDARKKILVALKTAPDGETTKAIADMTGLQPRVVGPALAALADDGAVIDIKVTKANGRGERTYDGWKLTERMLDDLERLDEGRRRTLAAEKAVQTFRKEVQAVEDGGGEDEVA